MPELSDEPSELRSAVESIRRGEFGEAGASRRYEQGRDAVTLVLLALAAAAVSPHARSSSTPVLEKPSPQGPEVRRPTGEPARRRWSN